MDGVGGLAGWRWIFILEGIVTVVIGATLHWTLPDNPETASFLKPWERAVIVRRLAEDAGTRDGHVDMHDKASKGSILSVFSEWKLYMGMIIVRLIVWELNRVLTTSAVVGKFHSCLWLLIHGSCNHRRSRIYVGGLATPNRPHLCRWCN